MAKELYRVYIPKYAKQRGTGKPINRNEAIVFDFMPVLIGDKFRTDKILSMQLFRNPPEHAPCMLEDTAYSELGMRYIQENRMVPALECYKIALAARTGFIGIISQMQDVALLNPVELGHMQIESPLEKALMQELVRREQHVSPEVHAEWVEQTRALYKKWKALNKSEYGSQEYIELSAKLGIWSEAICNAGKSQKRKIKQMMPKEILDVKFLKKYIKDNFPESTIGRSENY